MSFWHLFEAKSPYDREPHGILMRYFQNFRYFTFAVAVLWLLLVLGFKSGESSFSAVRFVILITIGAVYMMAIEAIIYLVCTKRPECFDRLIKIFMIADIVIITAGVIFSGGAASPFVLMYMFPIANLRIVFGKRGSFVVAALCMASYLAAMVAAGEFGPLDLINFSAVIIPCFFFLTYYLGLILESERNSRMEKAELGDAYNKSMLLYNLSKELNKTSDFRVIGERVFKAIAPVVEVRGMKVLFDEDQKGSCQEIYSYETEEIEWDVRFNYESGDELGAEVLKSVHCNCGFFVLPFGEKARAGMIVLRGSKESLQPEQYEVYLKTVAEIAAASLQNTATLKKLAQQSVLDGLTELPNKRYFSRRLEETATKCRRYKVKYVAGMLDIDHFKSINDRYGHVFGDYILRSCAQIVRSTLRNADVVARYGGEEFGIIMPHTDMDGALNLMERVRKLVEETVFSDDGETCRITVSIGIAAGHPQMSAVEVIRLADQALYTAKKNGRNRVVCAEQA